ncbi:MAG: hypothetical protein ABI134_18225, partial [Byssovorax sp.]
TETDSAERAMQLFSSSATSELNKHSSTQQASLRHGRFLDARWTRFLDELGENVVELSDSADVKAAATSALAEGRIVRATGTFFLDDFGWIRTSLDSLPKYFDLQERQQRAEAETQLAAFDALKASGAQRNQIEAKKQELKAQIAANAANVKAQLGSYVMLSELVTAMYGDGVECGVALSGSSPVAIRGVLDRTWLRESGSILVQRYGSRSSVGFTIVGLVTRLSWSERIHLSEEERKGWEMMQKKQSPSESSNESMSSAHGAVGAAQAVMERMRDMLMSRSNEQAVFVSPLAIYRSIALPELSTPRGATERGKPAA